MNPREANPRWRYLAVPVQPPGKPEAMYVIRMQTKRKGLSGVSQQVPGESDVDLQRARTFDTKKQARDYGAQLGYTVVEVDRSKSLKTNLLR